jgi:uncharacterized membrane protein required for colicin V production
MELATILAFLSDKSTEFVGGSFLGVLIGFSIAYIYVFPKLVKASNAALTAQVKLLSDQVSLQTSHITHLEKQVKALQGELQPYKEFALKHFQNAMENNAG